jgi:hypothetical protein
MALTFFQRDGARTGDFISALAAVGRYFLTKRTHFKNLNKIKYLRYIDGRHPASCRARIMACGDAGKCYTARRFNQRLGRL